MRSSSLWASLHKVPSMAPEQAQQVLNPHVTAEKVARSSVAHESSSFDMDSLLHLQMISGASCVPSGFAGWSSLDPNLCAKRVSAITATSATCAEREAYGFVPDPYNAYGIGQVYSYKPPLF